MDSLRISRLTDRQRLCLRHVHAHLSSKEIATKVGIEPGTVDQHIKAAMLILGVCDRRHAARMLVSHEAAMPDRPAEMPPETAHSASPAANIEIDMLAAIRHGLSNVLNFSGRDTRGQFRLYAIFLFVLGATTVFSILQTRVLLAFMQLTKLAGAHPEQFRDFAQWKRDHPELLPDFGGVPLILGLIILLHLALIVAAVARRRHDWTRLELWGWLPLPLLNIGLIVRPATVMLIFPIGAIFVFLYALVRGGAPERIATLGFGIGGLLFFFAFSAAGPRIGESNVNILAADSVSLLGYILLALRANRFWLIWMAGLHSLSLVSHLILLMNPRVDPAAYGLLLTLSGPFMLLMLAVGTRNHQLRLRQNGVDPAWIPLARFRRDWKAMRRPF